MVTGAITTVVFDLGNVLINFDHRIAAKRILPYTDKSPDEIYRLFFDSHVTQYFEEGKLSAAEFFEKVRKLLSLSLSFEEFLPIWNEIFFLTDDNRQVHALARNLKEQYTVAILSNINLLHHRYLAGHFDFFKAFHRVFTSYELGVIKPNPAIYEKVLAALRLNPSEVFYTDDRKELIEAAGKLGIRSFLYRTPTQLEKDLSSCGINLDREAPL